MIKIVRKEFKLIYKFFQYLYIFSWNEVMQSIDIHKTFSKDRF